MVVPTALLCTRCQFDWLFDQSKWGAITYNFIHHKALAILLYLTGSFIQWPELQLAGLVMFGHSSLDRVLGFGLQPQEGI